MRIFQLIEAAGNSALPESQTWFRNLYEPLIDLGCEVTLISTAKARAALRYGDKAALADFNDQTLSHFRLEHARKPFDLVFAYVVDGVLAPETLAEFRRAGVPSVNFSCNNAHQFHLVCEISRHFDFNLHSEGDSAHHFTAAGARPLWWPMASNPTYAKPVDVARTMPVSFVGANYALRAQYIGQLLGQGIDAHAYGPTWRYGARSPFRAKVKRASLLAQTLLGRGSIARARASANLAALDYTLQLNARFADHLHAPVSDEELIALYSRSEISLGCVEVFAHNDPIQPLTRHIHLREFEAPMCGALYCTGFVGELETFFEDGKEIVIYRSQDELVDKVRYYLSHPKEAAAIRVAARRRALAEHTYQRRFQKLFEQIGIGARAQRPVNLQSVLEVA